MFVEVKSINVTVGAFSLLEVIGIKDDCTAEADRARREADRSKAEADKSSSSASTAASEAGKAKTEADRSKLEADKAKGQADSIKSVDVVKPVTSLPPLGNGDPALPDVSYDAPSGKFTFVIPQGRTGSQGEGIKLIGDITVANANLLVPANLSVGDAYIMLDGGTVTVGNNPQIVVTGDLIAWGASGSFVNLGQVKGVQGDKGDKGDQGIQGQTGIQGQRGLQGDKGDTGADSTVAGPTGPLGPEGPKGDSGTDGNDSTVAGPEGPTGPTGPAGAGIQIQGSATVAEINALVPGNIANGDAWVMLDAGTITVGIVSIVVAIDDAIAWDANGSFVNLGNIVGPKGDTGDQGIQGDKGDTGDKGDAGTGIYFQGNITVAALNLLDPIDFSIGFAWIMEDAGSVTIGTTPIDVLVDDVAIWDGTDMVNAGNIQGPKGDKGDTGDAGNDGDAATIAVGSTTTGAEGTDADVTNSGTTSAAILDFVIPRGAKGDIGVKGDTGDDSTVVGPTGPGGPEGPQGIEGEQGPDGPRGAGFQLKGHTTVSWVNSQPTTAFEDGDGYLMDDVGTITTGDENIEVTIDTLIVWSLSSNRFVNFGSLSVSGDWSDIENIPANVTNALPTTGGAMSGPIIQSAAPTLDTHLTNKAYVDSIGDSKVSQDDYDTDQEEQNAAIALNSGKISYKDSMTFDGTTLAITIG